MIRTCARRGAFTLVELLAVLALSTIVAGILGRMVVDAIYLHRIAAEHADRMAVIDSLDRQLRDDCRAAERARWDGHSLDLTPLGAVPSAIVRYVLDDRRVARLADNAETHVWQSKRLRFDVRVESGAQAAVFHLVCHEEPPPRATALPVRAFDLAFVLPLTGAEHSPRAGGQP